MSDSAPPTPANELAKAFDPSAIEERWAAYWVAEKIFATREPGENAGSFTVLLPPPNVTGRLHMGHMLEHTQMDILTRWHRMSGDRTLWIPGTDHASIATQMLLERQLAAEGTTTREQMGREAFLKRAWAWKHEYGTAITAQMRRLGDSVDWAREYFTMDPQLSAAVIEAFVRLHEQGLVYRGAYVVNWDPQAQTAVSDLEVDTDERAGFLYHLRYPLADGTGSITIATTRPETLLGDVAVAVNPTDERYLHLIGKLVALPLSGVHNGPGRMIPILADDWAKPEFGTGAVKVTPAHDANDFAIGQRHALPSLNILDKTAHIDLPGSPYHGLDRFGARKQILADLDAQGLLVKTEPHTIATPVSQRTGAVIEPRLSDQWFVAVGKSPVGGGPTLGERSIAAVREGHIRFTPEMYRSVYMNWMENLFDWCISRQLWWGHRIPAWYCADGHITVARSTPAACTTCGTEELTQDPDVLDTWFSAGLLPFTVFGWPVEPISSRAPASPSSTSAAEGSAAASLPPDLEVFYPTDLLVTGSDILFFWVARMIMLSTHFMAEVPNADGSSRALADTVPFRNVYIHGLIRDANREKMSKTKGNVVDPLDVIGRFGTDAVRFTLASMASPGSDIAFSEERTEGNRAFANKIWNAARFLFMNLDRAAEAGVDLPRTALAAGAGTLTLPADTPLETRWMVSRLSAVSAEVDRGLAAYRFDEAASAVYQFFWGELCDWYLELVKLRLTFEAGVSAAGRITLDLFVTVFEAALRLLSPFMPFLTEEIWHALHAKIDGAAAAAPMKSVALTRYPQAADYPGDAAAEREMTLLQDLIVTVRAIRKELATPEKEAAPIRIFATNRAISALASTHADMLARMARVASVTIAPAPLTGNGARSTPEFDVEVVFERTVDVAAERERLGKDLAKYEKGLQAAERQLGNEAFMAKAPAHIVDGLRKQSADTRLLYEKAQAALAQLPSA